MSGTVLFFDLGGVLVENRGYDALRDLGLGTTDGQAIRTRWLRSPAVAAFERGRIPSGEFADRVIAEFGLAMPPERFLAAFRTWVKDFYPGARDLVARLRRRHRVGCLSNCNDLHWREEWADLFDFPLASHRIGLVKPDPAAFLKMAETSGRPPGAIVFFDDTLVNVEAARALGFRAFLASHPRDIEAVCRAEGLG
jgi:putative hydrolase of the HAD superfamily